MQNNSGENLQSIIDESITDFPTLPTIYSNLLEMMSNPNTSLDDLANLISKDPASTIKILRTVNSAVYGLQGKVSTINQAIFHVGFNEVKNLIMAISVMDVFRDTSSVKSLSLIDLWKHSIAVGVITRAIGKAAGIKKIDNYYIAGMLHDLGKLFFLRQLNEKFKSVLKEVEQSRISIYEAEFMTLGMNHEESGELIANKWSLPKSIVDSIRYHHSGVSPSSEDRVLVACVHLANIYAKLLEYGYSGDDIVHRPNPEIWSILDLEHGKLKLLLPEIKEAYDQTVSILLLSS